MTPTDTSSSKSRRLSAISPDLERLLTRGGEGSPPRFGVAEITCETVYVPMRDGTRLATDVYLPPRLPAPAAAMRTPYGRANPKMRETLVALAQSGYVVISQDCRGTGESEPDSWDFYIYEPEDSFDFIEWVSRQSWFDGFVGAFGSSYVAQTQWCMAMHPRMSAIVPEVSGLGVARRMVRKYMFYNAYARSVGKGADKVPTTYEELERQMSQETLAGGYFNEPLDRTVPSTVFARYPDLRALPSSQAIQELWNRYCTLTCSQRADLVKEVLGVRAITILEIDALTAMFGLLPVDAHTVPYPEHTQTCGSLHAPALMITGWYDWSMNDALATWELLMRAAPEAVRAASRLIITPSAHNTPGYHEGRETHPELQHSHRVPNHPELLLRWYAAVRKNALENWPKVIYYLMGANEWYAASAWPPADSRELKLYLSPKGTLESSAPEQGSVPDVYTYDPTDPTPTVGGSVVSSIYTSGSVDVSSVQARSDVLNYTTTPFEKNMDVVGPLRLILYASSSAVDTDFSARLSDVFPDGRAIQLQSGILRARYRGSTDRPELLERGRIYRLEIDMWATANRFRAGHCLRLDISSADFPRFDRNTNRGGESGAPVPAVQTIYHDPERPSYLVVKILNGSQNNE